MKKFALITTLLLGAAPMVQAQPRHDADHYRDHDQGQRWARHAQLREARQAGWVPLATMDIRRKQTVDFPRDAGRFRALRIQAVAGVGYVDFVTVRYGNGQQQHVDIKRRIGRDEVFDLDTQGRHVEALTLHGRPERRDTRVQIIGMR